MEKAKIEGFQASSQQQRLWSLQQADNSPAYRAQAAFLIEGDIRTELLKAAIQDVVSRHEILRTSLRYLPGRAILVQLIRDQSQLPLNVVDLSDKDERAQEAELETLFNQRKRQPFDFEDGPLVYADLVQMSREKHALLFTASSLCADGRTMENLIHELGVSIASHFDAGVRFDEPMQYCDFAQWQYEILESEETEEGKWRWRNSNLPDLLKLNSPFKKPTAHDGAFAPEAFHFAVETELAVPIRTLLKTHDSQMSTLLLATWAALHWRLVGQSDICIAMVSDGRKYTELERAMGPFARHLPLQCQLEGNITFLEVLRRVHHSIEESSKWEECFSWERVNRSATGGKTEPFCPLSFEFATHPESHSVAGITISVIRRQECIDRFELMLRCIERNDALHAELHYDSNLFQEQDISRLSSLYCSLLQSCVGNPEARIEELNILTHAERQKLLFGFNDTGTPYDLSRPIHCLIEEQAKLRPDSLAVIFENQRLSYDELNFRGDQMAHYLRGVGVGPDVPVGVCVEPSLEMLVAILGVLKAGGAYVPLDPSYPRDRLIFMMNDTQSPVLLTQRRHLEIFQLPDLGASWSCTKLVCLDTDWERISESPEVTPPSQVVDKNLAYVIYTSGSTGKPKGVLVTHRNLRNSTLARLGYYCDPISCFLLLSSFSFDSSMAGIFGTLCQGGTVLLVAESARSDGPELIMLIERHQVSHTLCLPSLYSVILEQAGLRQFSSFRAVIVAGAACPKGLVDHHHQRFTSTALFNEYGPTEATVWTTVCECRSEDPSARPPIGRPIANAQVYLLSPALRPSPIGIEGELYVGGENVTRGYLNRPDLTAERFVADPVSGKLGARLYKTGDLARYRTDGNIEFFGRSDHQVKIRGYRIELGEIEAALKHHRLLREAIVTSLEERPGEERLVAYVVPTQMPGPAIDELRGFLRDKLPGYMIPSIFVELESLPLAPNGKVDRGALPAPDRARADRGREFVAPRTPIEEVVAGSWAEVLGIEQVSATDNFFDLGGHSINTTQVISRLSDAFQVDLPVRSLFESPTVAGLAERVEAVWGSTHSAEASPIERAPREQSLPLSFGQERLWFLHQLEPDNTAYNVPHLARLKGPVKIQSLEQSINEVIRRHEVLRTTFLEVNGIALQAIAQPVRSPIPIVDLEDIPASKWEKLARSLLVQDAKRAFDLEQSPLLRVVIVRLTNEEHILLLTMHHIISDGWSMGVLVRELAAIYDPFSTATPSPLPELPFQYADYSRWQREWFRIEKMEAELSYWKQQLGRGLPALQLSTDRPRPPTQTFHGATHSFSLQEGLSKNLRSLSRQEGATLFMTLVAAFQILLYRYSGQDDIPLGTPIANRNRAKVEGLIGFFANTLVLRIDLSGNPTYREVLARVREITLDAYANQNLPFEQLVDSLRPERDLARSPLFQVMFILQNAPLPRLEISKLAIDMLEVHNETAKFDLTLSMMDSDKELLGTFEYNTDLFDRPRIVRMANHFQLLLKNIEVNPNLPISDLRMLSEVERHHALIEWNETQEEFATAGQVHQLIEEQTGRTPDAVAARFEDEQASYDELNNRANQLAHYLRSLGVGPETSVGVFTERSIEMIVGLLAILKAGGAYVPIDPGYPQQRLRYTLEDARSLVLLSQSCLQDRLRDYKGQVVYLDEDWEKIGQYSRINLDSKVRAEGLAYVIYTSGSTGFPKGVQIERRAVANFMISMHRRLALSSADVLLAVTTLSFDIAGLELFLPLMVGARVVALSHEAAADGIELLKQLQAAQATVMQATPATWQMLLAAGWHGSAHLKVLCGGDALSRELATQLRMRSASLWNLYGPTETTIWSAVAEVEGADAVVSIGRPIGNTGIYLLNSKMAPIPIGAPGDLYIGGNGLARGYFNRPDLTAERFLPSPFALTAGDRLYDTGDLASYLDDGRIEFFGRADHQVKVRGFRIELGEIEEQLRVHTGVREAVVVARDDPSGSRQLVAYIVPEREPAPQDDELRSFLRARLPEYMAPANYVVLESLPLTPNGKVDRRALPDLSKSGFERELSFVAPRTEVESRLSAIWAQVLGLERVGVHDNFFKLGGDSILGIQIISKAKQAGYTLVAKDIFRHQNIAELAAAIVANQGLDADLSSVTNQAPLTPIQHLIFEQDLAEPNNCAWAILLETPQDFSEELLEETLGRLLDRHDALRLRFIKGDEGWRQVDSQKQDAVRIMQTDLSGLPEPQRQQAVKSTTARLQSSLNLSEGPLFQVALFSFGAESSKRLLILVHRLVSDFISCRILIEDLQSIYSQLNCGQNVAPSPKTASYVQWAQHLAQYAKSPDLGKETEYWLANLRTEMIGMPVDFPAGVNSDDSAYTITIALDEEETQSLLQDVRQVYNSRIEEILITALAMAFAEWTGTDKLLVDIEGPGRVEAFPEIDLSRTVGCFGVVFPLMLELGGAVELDAAVKRIKEQMRSIPRRGIGYGLLRYLDGHAQGAETLRTAPRPQVSFRFLEQLDDHSGDSSPFRIVSDDIEPHTGLRPIRKHLLDITGRVINKRLWIGWAFSTNIYLTETVERLGRNYLESLRSIITFCLTPEAGDYTPSDFPEAGLSQEEINSLLARFGQSPK